MTVKQLIAQLQALDNHDLPVLCADQFGNCEVTRVDVDSDALIETEEREHREKVMAFHDGKEIMVEVPKFTTHYTYLPGVVLS